MAEQKHQIVYEIIMDEKGAVVGGGRVKKVTSEMKKETVKATKKMGDSIGGLKKNWLLLAGGIASAFLLIKKGFNLTKEFLKFKQSTIAMEKQFGLSSDVILKKLKEVSGGTISSTNLITAANRAMALNVTKDVGKMADLLEIARVKARIMGTDTTQAFNDIVTGIGRASPLILDNLGIITKGWAEEAKAAGVAMNAQFILNKILKDGAEELKNVGDIVLTDAERLARFNAILQDLGLQFGKFTSRYLLPAIEHLTKFFEIWNKAGEQVERFGFILNIHDEELIRNITLNKEAAASIQQWERQLSFLNEKVKEGGKQTRFWKKQLKSAKKDLEEYIDGFGLGTIKNVEDFFTVFNTLVKEQQKLEGLKTPGLDKAETEGNVKELKTTMADYYDFLGKQRERDLEEERKRYEEIKKFAIQNGLDLQEVEKQHQENIKKIRQQQARESIESAASTAQQVSDVISDAISASRENQQSLFVQQKNDELAQFEAIANAEIASIEQQGEKNILNSEQVADKRKELESSLDAKRKEVEGQINQRKREDFEKQKKSDKSQAWINTFVGITRAFATSKNFLTGAIQAGLILASGIIQVNKINSQQPGFKKGGRVGQIPGYGGGDIINAKLEPGEFVVKKEAVTDRSIPLLHALNNSAPSGLAMQTEGARRMHFQTGGQVPNVEQSFGGDTLNIEQLNLKSDDPAEMVDKLTTFADDMGLKLFNR